MALEAMMLISQKRPDSEGKQLVKGRLVTIGSKQRSYEGYEKSDGSAPTVKTDSVFLTGVIDAREKRRVRMFDIANAFLTADNDEFVLVVLRERMAELVV